ncbi:MAG TPA: radical SAM protein [Ktedonobacteraceae bacterium]|nr:radical SAM protein [Ktedonobacteraceae bacterium]
MRQPAMRHSLKMAAPAPVSHDPPALALADLDTLWLQVTGTLCNIACLHCFITCGPKNHQHEMMTVEQVREALDEARKQGVREYYFTGGEPFLHPDIQQLITMTLAQGPLSILTNGILIDEEMATWLANTFRSSQYSLDLRVSLDGSTPEDNDRVRGKGTFARITAGIERLARHGLNPVITVTEVRPDMGMPKARTAFIEFVRSLGLEKPRMKYLTPFLIGREEQRTRGYTPDELLHEGDLLPGEAEKLQCSSCRMITDDGVYPCPLVINIPSAKMGERFSDGLRPIKLAWQPCYTCHIYGVTCRT